jgi:hypothetical protein
MNVIDALVAHHGVLRQLYQQAESNPNVFEEFSRHLVVHHTMEEKYFYDLLQKFEEANHDALEAVNEHHIIELIIKDSEGFPRDHKNFPIKIEGLGEYTTHHLDEEEAEIFPMALQLFTPEDLSVLGELFLEAKEIMLGVVIPDVPKAISSIKGKPGKGIPSTAVSDITTPLGTAIGLGIGSLKK